MYGKRCVVRFYDGVRYFRGRYDGVCIHDSIGIFFANFRDEQRSHTGSGTTAQRVGQLETLQAVAAFGLFPDYVEDRVYQFGTFGVMTFCPIVTSSRLSKHEIIWSKYLAKWSRANGVHRAWLQIDEDGTWYVFPSRCFIIVYVDSFQLKIGIAMISTGWVDAMLVTDDFPKL